MPLVQAAFAIRPNEVRRVTFFWGVGVLLAIAANLGGTASLSLFIRRYGVDHLPAVFILTALCVIAFMAAYNAFSASMSKERYQAVLLGISAVIIAAIWVVIRAGVPSAYLILYPAFSVITTVVYTHFGAILFDYFDTLESKRLFSVIFSSISVGGIVGGLGTKLLLEVIDTADILLVWMLFILLSAAGTLLISVLGISRVETRRKGRRRESSLGFMEALRSNTRSVIREPLVRHIVLASTTVVACNYIIQFLASKVFDRAFPVEADLTAFLGVFSAVAAFVTLLLQTAVVPRLMARVGVGPANLAYPLLLIGSLGGLFFFPMLPVAMFAFFTRRYLSKAVGESAANLLFNGLPGPMKGRAMAFVGSYAEPFSVVTASLLILAVNQAFGSNDPRSVTVLASCGAVLACVHLVQKNVIRQAYVRSLVALVRTRRMRLVQLADHAWDGPIAELPVEDYLRSSDVADVATALHYVRLSPRSAWSTALRAVFPDKRSDIQIEILNVLADTEGSGAGEFVLEQARDADAHVRAAAIGHLARLDNGDLLAELGGFPADSDDEVRRATVAAFLQSGDLDKMAFALGKLGQRLESDDAGVMLSGVDIAVRTEDRRLIRSLRLVLDRWEGAPRQDIINAMCEMENGKDERNLRTFHALLGHVVGSELAPVMAALSRIGAAPTVIELERHFDRLDRVNQIRAVDVLDSIGEAGASMLEEVVLDGRLDVEVRVASLRALDGASVEQTHLTLLRTERAAALKLLALLAEEGKRPEPDELLAMVAGEQLRDRLTVWLHAASRLSRRPDAALLAIDDVASPSKAARADALETLENILGARRWRTIAPAFDDLAPAARLAALRAPDVVPPDLPWMRDHAPPWLLACAIASSDDGADLEPVLEFAQTGGVAVVEEAARIASRSSDEGAPMLSTFERVVLLKHVPIFSRLDSRALQVVAGISTEEAFAEGDLIFAEGDAGDAMYVIHHGQVRIWQGDRRDEPLLELGRARFFGEMSILSGEPRSASAGVDDDTECLRIDGDRFQKLLIDYPLMCMPIFSHLLARLRDSDERGAALREQVDRLDAKSE